MNRAQEQGVEPPTVVRNVIDFLFLYGHFVSWLSHSVVTADGRLVKTLTKTMMMTKTRKRTNSISLLKLLKEVMRLNPRKETALVDL